MPDENKRRRRKRSRSKKRNRTVEKLLQNLGWIVAAAAVGLPLLALALYALHEL